MALNISASSSVICINIASIITWNNWLQDFHLWSSNSWSMRTIEIIYCRVNCLVVYCHTAVSLLPKVQMILFINYMHTLSTNSLLMLALLISFPITKFQSLPSPLTPYCSVYIKRIQKSVVVLLQKQSTAKLHPHKGKHNKAHSRRQDLAGAYCCIKSSTIVLYFFLFFSLL